MNLRTLSTPFSRFSILATDSNRNDIKPTPSNPPITTRLILAWIIIVPKLLLVLVLGHLIWVNILNQFKIYLFN